MTPEPGLTIADKYRLDRVLAEGGMGAIWVAEHLDLGVEVAVKLMSDDVAKSPLGRKRFRREARAAARLKSPNVTQIHDYGVFDDTPYMVMELLEGEDLGHYLDRKVKLSVARSAEILTPVCHALKLAHDAGIVHRDLKPSNLFLSRSGDQEVVKILDFGIAKQTVSETSVDGETASGVLVGSPRYMSPEQAQGLTVDHRSDIWSLGVVLYEMLTGELPFDGDNLGQLITSICLHEAPAPTTFDETLPGAADDLFAVLLAADPDSRIDSASTVAAALKALAEGAPLSFAAPEPMPRSEPPPPRSARSRDEETMTSQENVAYAATAPLETPPPDATSPGLGIDSEERERPPSTRPWWLAAAGVAAVAITGWALLRGPAEGPSAAERVEEVPVASSSGATSPTASTSRAGAPSPSVAAAETPAASSSPTPAVPSPSSRPAPKPTVEPVLPRVKLGIPLPRPKPQPPPPPKKTDDKFGIPIPSPE